MEAMDIPQPPQSTDSLVHEAAFFALAVVTCLFLFGLGSAAMEHKSAPMRTVQPISYGKIDMTSSVSGILPVATGGTCMSSYTVGELLYASPRQMKVGRYGGDDENVLNGGGGGALPPRVK